MEDQEQYQPSREPERKIDPKIAEQMTKSYVKKFDKILENSQFAPDPYVTFSGELGPVGFVSIDKKGEDEEKEGDFAYLPSSSNSPSYLFEIGWPEQVSTPYGSLPHMVLGADNKLYMFEASYILNQQGQAVKIEKIICLTDCVGPKDLEDWVKIATGTDGKIPKVEFTPSEKDAGAFPLEAGDFEQIGFFLKKIENGEFKERIS